MPSYGLGSGEQTWPCSKNGGRLQALHNTAGERQFCQKVDGLGSLSTKRARATHVRRFRQDVTVKISNRAGRWHPKKMYRNAPQWLHKKDLVSPSETTILFTELLCIKE